jgi:hypothetical protein
VNVCAKCKFLRDHRYFPITPNCAHPDNLKLDLVTGNKTFIIYSAYTMRDSGPCGPEGKLFTPK